MTYIVIIWCLVFAATLGLIFGLGLLKSFVDKIILISGLSIDIHYKLIDYLSIVTLIIAIIWYATLIIFQLFLSEFDLRSNLSILTVVTISTVFATLVIIIKFILMQIDLEGIKEQSNGKMRFNKVLIVLIAICYAAIVNYGVQSLIMFLYHI